MKSKYNKEDLYQMIIVQKLTYFEISKMYNVSSSAIRKAAKRLNIIAAQRRKINKTEHFNKGISKYQKLVCPCCGKDFIDYPTKHTNFCSTACYNLDKKLKSYEYFLTTPVELQRSDYNPRRYKEFIFKEQDCKCALCEITNTWNNKNLVFVLDHIDGNAANNSRENLRLVCPNCDSQLDTFKSKNKNSTRLKRYRATKIIKRGLR